MKKVAVYAITPQGAALGRHLAEQMDADLFLPSSLAEIHGAIPFDGIIELVKKTFSRYPRHIFIAATGIVIRAIAPHLRSKVKDPAVVALDQHGQYVISLLSGHLGGANQLAGEVAALSGGTAVITTATDTAGVPSFDLLAEENELTIANLEAVKTVNMAVLRGEPLQIFDAEDRLGLKNQDVSAFAVRHIGREEQWDQGSPGVWVTWKTKDSEPNHLVLHPRSLIAGIGCNRGTQSREIVNLVMRTFRTHALALGSLQCLVSIDKKQDEAGLLDAARELGVPLFFFSPSELADVEVPHPSNVVKKHLGVSSVCEAAALLKSSGKSLLVPKTKSRNVTLAVGLEG